MLYAWCRHCDDLIDGQELGFKREAVSPEQARQRLQGLREQTRAVLAGEPAGDPVFAGLQRVAASCRIPDRYPLELIDGFAMDVNGTHYARLEDTLLYCYHVAGVVGVMMAHVMGVTEPEVLRRAADLGIAFQLTNISRDVLDDASNGRIYLPADWLAEAGIPPAELAAPEWREALFAVVSRLLGVADRYYLSAHEGVRALGFRAGWAVSTAAGVYGDIGNVVRRRGPQAWDRRAVVPAYRKLIWGVRGALAAAGGMVLGRLRGLPPRASDLWLKPDLC